jgi:alpha-mannosidase
MITVHLVLNAHIDPVWLWPWQSGLDEVLATCRSACDRLDNNPDIVFTRGEAWAYDVVERTDPELFARISAHVTAGRWEIVGGWWIQPDCNLPTALGLQRQIELGRDYFQSRFGQFPRVGFNVDSFGHAAALPGLMRRYGQDRYVMMRPQEHEKALPARLFRWRGQENGEEVTTFRIARAYATRDVTAEHILASLEGLPAGISHTMCFVGVGDHGGGPTERQIQWCRDHTEVFDGCRLEFSSPSRFFDAVSQDAADLPLVTGELQHHAVGCYSVSRAIKVAVRRAEETLAQAEIVAEADPAPDPGTEDRLAAA